MNLDLLSDSLKARVELALGGRTKDLPKTRGGEPAGQFKPEISPQLRAELERLLEIGPFLTGTEFRAVQRNLNRKMRMDSRGVANAGDFSALQDIGKAMKNDLDNIDMSVVLGGSSNPQIGETIKSQLKRANQSWVNYKALEETAADTAAAAGDIVYADAANSMGSRLAKGAARSHMVSDGSDPKWRKIDASERTDSQTATTTSYVTLAASGVGNWEFAAEVEVSVTTGTHALVLMAARLVNDTAGSATFLSYSVSGATTIASADSKSIRYDSSVASDNASFGGWDWVTALTAGSNTFTLEGKVDGNIGTIATPRILVMPLN